MGADFRGYASDLSSNPQGCLNIISPAHKGLTFALCPITHIVIEMRLIGAGGRGVLSTVTRGKHEPRLINAYPPLLFPVDEANGSLLIVSQWSLPNWLHFSGRIGQAKQTKTLK